MKIEFQPIGVIHSPFEKVEGIPIQPSHAQDVKGTVEVFPEFAEGLCDLDGFSHIILLYHLHESRSYRLKVVPFLDADPRGLFATRAPNRPNPIGLSVVRLVAIVENKLFIEGVDILDGTPLLDIKPHVDDFEAGGEVRVGWLGSVRRQKKLADDRFK
jgi:tRNA-Thr(GGU) m(6)t(6)A37 methyltransferase TsaA